MEYEPDAKQADESSPSAPVTEEAPIASVAVEDLSKSQRDKWLETGDLPKEKQDAKEEDSQSSEKEKEEKKDAESEESQTSTEATEKEVAEESVPVAKPQAKAEIPPSEARIRDLVAKTRILEQEIARLKQPVVQKPQETEAQEPKPEDFETVAEYLSAKVQHEVSQGIKKDREARDAEAVRIQVETKNKETIDRWNKSVNEARKKYPDFEAKAFSEDFVIQEGSVLDRWCLESDKGTDVLYYYATHPEEYAKLNQIANPMQAAIEIARTETRLVDKLKPAAKLVSNAPPPPKEVSGRGTATDDPIAEALASGDISKYMDLMNKQERQQFASRK
jgi:hypothetical protein